MFNYKGQYDKIMERKKGKVWHYLTKKAVKFTEKTIEKSSELADTAKTKVSIKSAEADLDDQFIELGKLYYEVLNKDNVFDEKAAPVVQKIDEINQRIESLKLSLEKE